MKANAAGEESTDKGTPQGSPLSPLLSNILLDDLDKELERRAHASCRYADDCNVYAASRRSGERVMRSLIGFLEGTLELKVNRAKSAVDRPVNRVFRLSEVKGFAAELDQWVRRRWPSPAIRFIPRAPS